uniref:Peptidase aspartic putative domain-containing protein n=1 Tax=Anopheles quadriannulatus TaxID=34691 RepID=A0A182X104_ANOQN
MAAPCSANSTVKQLPSIQSAFVDASLTPSQKAARENTPKELPIFSGTNLIRLQRALKGPALESVDHLLLLPDGLADVLDILRSEYGRPDLIVDSLVEKVRRLPPVRSERLESLAIFGKAVRKMCATIKASGLKEYDCNVTLLKELVAKLPAERRLEWARHKVKLPRKSVVEFGKWFTEIAIAASTEVNPFERNLHVEQSRSQPARKPPMHNHHLNFHVTRTCKLCHDSCRTLTDCARFCELTVRERLHGEKGTVKTFAFLDEGSSATFVDRELIDELGMDGKLHPVTLKWTDNTTRDEVSSLKLSLRVSGLSKGASIYNLPTVHTLKKLELPAQTLSVQKLSKEYPHLKGLKISSYSGIVPRIIIGMDNVYLGKPSRCIEGDIHEPIAVKTRLGWT